MPVCIAGMHRSGTSMLAHILHLSGLYLGPEEVLRPSNLDNQDGFWEHLGFNEINDELLAQFGGAWDSPPLMPEGWVGKDEHQPLRDRAEALVSEFSGREPWGWKDPRNSLTLPFWFELVPDLKLVVCLRNPFEVDRSLRVRAHWPRPFGLRLWRLYNQAILDASHPEDRIVTHYDAYFREPRAELRRVLGFLGLPAPEEVIERGCSAIAPGLRHNSPRASQLSDGEANHSSEGYRLYMRMCDEANFSRSHG